MRNILFKETACPTEILIFSMPIHAFEHCLFFTSIQWSAHDISNCRPSLELPHFVITEVFLFSNVQR